MSLVNVTASLSALCAAAGAGAATRATTDAVINTCQTAGIRGEFRLIVISSLPGASESYPMPAGNDDSGVR